MEPICRDRVDAVIHSREPSRDTAGGVGVVAEVHGFEDALGKAAGGEKAPKGGFERVQHIAAGFDGGLRGVGETWIQQGREVGILSMC